MLLGMRSVSSRIRIANLLSSTYFLTHYRAGGAMMTDSTGKTTWAPENTFTYSEDFTNSAWIKTNSTISANAATAPDGTLTADKLIESNGVNRGRVFQGPTTVAGDILSIYAKAAEWGRLALGHTNGSGFWAVVNFNLSNGTFGSPISYGGSTVTNATMVAVGDGWYRCSVKVGASPTLPVIMPFNQDGDPVNPTPALNGDGVSGIYVWGAQRERRTYETSPLAYNPTTTAAYYSPRFDYDPATLAALGLLLESARTNIVLWNRDLTNAAWTKTDVTAVKDQTGIDGVASSASKITATADNGTVLQARTLASSARSQSAYVKRLAGSGTIEMTMDNGATWTPITVTADWTRVSIPTQTLANPTVGFRIVTSGDAIAVDFVQNENGAFITSPIWTSTASVTRATDSIAAALFTSNPAIIQLRDLATGVRSRKSIDLLSSISSEINEWIEQIAVYPIGTSSAYRDAHLIVDGGY